MSKSTKYFDLFSALKAGGDKGVSPESLQKTLGFTSGALAVYIHALRHKFGAVVESVRNGRTVTAYRLVNIAECESKISPTRKPRTVKPKPTVAGYQNAKAKKAKAKVAVARVTKTVKAKAPKVARKNEDGPVEVEDLEVTEYSDRELADISAQLGIG